MPITAACPHCSGTFSVPDSAAGKRFKCPSCKQPMDVPAADAGGDDVIDIPSPEEAEALVGGDEDEDDDSDDEEEDADEDADDDADEDDAEDDADDEEEDTSASKKSKRDKKGVKGKDKDKGKKDKKAKKEKKPKKEKKSFSAPKVDMPKLDAGAAMGQVMGSLQRALHPSRVLTAAIGMALVLLTGAIITAIGTMIPVAIVQQLLMALSGLIVLVGYVIVMVAVAKVDLAGLRGEEIPGPIAAIKSAVGGGVGAIIAAFLIGLLVVGVVLVEGLVGLLAAIPYVGAVFGLVLVPLFFFINLALFAGLPLIQWLIIPLAADGGANPLAPIKGAIARVRREPARLAISFIMFVVFTSLILGFLWLLAAAAAGGAGATVITMHPMFSMSWVGSKAGVILIGLFTGSGMAIVFGLVLAPVISAYVCAGCQEIHDNPFDEDDEE